MSMEYTLAEAGVLVGRSASTLKHHVQKGTLRARKIGKTYVVSSGDLARYASDHRRPPQRVSMVFSEREDQP